MRRCSAFFRRSMARCCWSRYPAYLISVSMDLSLLLISDERWTAETLTAEDAEFAEELLSKNLGARSCRTGASCSVVIPGPFSSCANGCPTSEENSCGLVPLPAKAVELRSTWTGEGARPHTSN